MSDKGDAQYLLECNVLKPEDLTPLLLHDRHPVFFFTLFHLRNGLGTPLYTRVYVSDGSALSYPGTSPGAIKSDVFLKSLLWSERRLREGTEELLPQRMMIFISISDPQFGYWCTEKLRN